MELIAIGRISKPIGTRGEVKVLPLTDNMQRFAELPAVWIGRDAAHVEIKNILKRRIDAKQVVLRLNGFDTVEEAETLKDFYLFIQREAAVALQNGSYFIDDILGCEVVTDELREVGVVTDLFSLPLNDVWVIKKDSKKILIPAVKAIIRQVDVKKKRITIHSFEGLID